MRCIISFLDIIFFVNAPFSQQEKPHRWNANKNFIHFYTGWIKLPLWIFLHIYALKIFLFSSCYINAMFFFYYYYFHSSFVCVWEQQLWWKIYWIFTIVGTVIGVAVTVVCRHHHPCSSLCRLLSIHIIITKIAHMQTYVWHDVSFVFSYH